MKTSILIVTLILTIQGCHGQSYRESSHTGKWDLTSGFWFKDFPFEILEANKYSEKNFMFKNGRNNWLKKRKKSHWMDKKLFTPNNMIRIGEALFMDQTEIANINYQLFITFVQTDSADGHDKKYLPVSSSDYYLNPEYYFYPVIGINMMQASAYCLWRSRVLNLGLAFVDKIKPEPYSQLEDSVVKYGGNTRLIGRLPKFRKLTDQMRQIKIENSELLVTKGVIEYFKNDRNDEYQNNSQFLLEGNKISMLNVNLKVEGGLDLEIPSYIYSFYPSSNGFYNLVGNVAEMTLEGKVVGGDFNTKKMEDITQNTSKNYEFTGFRCVCEVIKKQP